MKTQMKTTSVALILATGMVIGGCAATAGAAWAERQPAMHTALDHLKAAEKALMVGTTDKGGHRVKALNHTRSAIKQTNKAIAFDNRH
jgi:hypothetical protein